MADRTDSSIDELESAGERSTTEQATAETTGNDEYRSEDGSLNATGAYEASDGVVLYDSEEPLAWVQSDNAVTLTEMV